MDKMHAQMKLGELVYADERVWVGHVCCHADADETDVSLGQRSETNVHCEGVTQSRQILQLNAIYQVIKHLQTVKTSKFVIDSYTTRVYRSQGYT
jgi:hypothetical protein